MEGVDLIIYINLNVRTDRREEIEREFKRLEIPESKILRWEAIRMTKLPLLGCGLSHIAVLEHILTLPESVQTVMILEDDFQFIEDMDLVKNSLKTFLEYPRDKWDMVMMSYYVLERADYDSLVSLTLMAQWASGYIMNRSAVPQLLANLKEAAEKYEKSKRSELHANDVYWWRVMAGRKYFYFNTALGHQRSSYSNIDGKIINRHSKVDLASPGMIKLHRRG